MRRKKPEPKLDCGVYQCQNKWVIHINGKYLCRAHADTPEGDWHAITAHANRKKLLTPPDRDQWYDEI